MNKSKAPWIVWVALAAFVAAAIPAHSEAGQYTPIEVTRQFLQGVAAKDREKVSNAFDFVWANRDLTAKLRAIDMTNPWNQKQIADTLLYYFFEPDQVSLAKQYLADDVEFEVRLNPQAKLALVILSVPGKQGQKPKQLATVGLRELEGRWQIVYFPEFYPVDYWKILTGVRAQP
jgi:hypothetical protein